MIGKVISFTGDDHGQVVYVIKFGAGQIEKWNEEQLVNGLIYG